MQECGNVRQPAPHTDNVREGKGASPPSSPPPRRKYYYCSVLEEDFFEWRKCKQDSMKNYILEEDFFEWRRVNKIQWKITFMYKKINWITVKFYTQIKIKHSLCKLKLPRSIKILPKVYLTNKKQIIYFLFFF